MSGSRNYNDFCFLCSWFHDAWDGAWEVSTSRRKHGMSSRFICLRVFTFCSYFSDTQFDFTFPV